MEAIPTAPLATAHVQAGFPSPAEDYGETDLNLHTHVVKHPTATFFVRAKGDSMTGAGIHDGDILAVDRSLKASSGSVIIAVLNGEITVKRLIRRGSKVILQAANPAFPPIELPEGSEFQVWGVVTHSLHSVK